MERFIPGEELTAAAPVDPAFASCSASPSFIDLSANLDEETDPFVAEGLRRLAKMKRESS